MDVYVLLANTWDCAFVIGVLDTEPSDELQIAMLKSYYERIFNGEQDQVDKFIDMVENFSIEKHPLTRIQIKVSPA